MLAGAEEAFQSSSIVKTSPPRCRMGAPRLRCRMNRGHGALGRLPPRCRTCRTPLAPAKRLPPNKPRTGTLRPKNSSPRTATQELQPKNCNPRTATQKLQSNKLRSKEGWPGKPTPTTSAQKNFGSESARAQLFGPRPGSPHSKKQTPRPRDSQRNSTLSLRRRNPLIHFGRAVPSFRRTVLLSQGVHPRSQEGQS